MITLLEKIKDPYKFELHVSTTYSNTHYILRLFDRTLKEIICECNGKPDHIIHGGIATTKEY